MWLLKLDLCHSKLFNYNYKASTITHFLDTLTGQYAEDSHGLGDKLHLVSSRHPTKSDANAKMLMAARAHKFKLTLIDRIICVASFSHTVTYDVGMSIFLLLFFTAWQKFQTPAEWSSFFRFASLKEVRKWNRDGEGICHSLEISRAINKVSGAEPDTVLCGKLA